MQHDSSADTVGRQCRLVDRTRRMMGIFLVAWTVAGGCNRSGRSSSTSPEDGSASRSATANQRITADDVDFHPTLKDRTYDATIHDIVAREDPTVDGWDSEAFSERANQQLKEVGKQIVAWTENGNAANGNAENGNAEKGSTRSPPICTDDFSSNHLRPPKLDTVINGAKFRVLRASNESNSVTEFRGRTDFAKALGALGAVFDPTEETHFKFKIIRVALLGDQATTRSYFQMVGSSKGGTRVQVNSTWDSVWTLDAETPGLKRVRVTDYEEVHANDTLDTFSDCTKAAFSGTDALERQFIYGRDHWYANLEATIGIEGRGNGIAIGDVNNDGLDDIYICQPAALPNRLFVRNPDGTLTDRSSSTGVDWLDSARGALFVDMNNDGDQDLVVALSNRIVLHENQGNGEFRQVGEFPTNSRLFSVNAVDYDNDGDLDLFACGYSSESQTRPEDIFVSPVPYHDAQNGAGNYLIRNDGGDFTDVTKEVGLDQNGLRFSLASAWEDYDNDGDVDLYVANDFGRNNLYRNDAGPNGGRTFVDVAAEAGVEDMGPGMSVDWADANNDGWMDLYVSNMFSSAGSRITHQRQFKPGAKRSDVEGFRRHARGNSLFLNQGDGTFADVATTSGTVMGRWAWGSQFVDMNNDGWQDIYVTNGFVTADNNNDL